MIIRENLGELPFTVFPNDLLNDPDLTAEALGVLVYLVSKPANWRVMPAELAKRFECGRDRVYKILNLLVEAGYARRDQDRGEGGSFANIRYVIFNVRQPLPENTDTADSPLTENPHTVKPTLQKKDSTKELLSQSSAEDFFPDEISKPAKKKRQTIPTQYPMTNRHKEYAAARGLANGHAELIFENFRNHHAAKGTLMLDWDAAWRTWVGNEIKFSAGRAPPRAQQPGYGDDWG